MPDQAPIGQVCPTFASRKRHPAELSLTYVADLIICNHPSGTAITKNSPLSLPWVAGRIAVVSMIWTASSIGFYEIQTSLGSTNGYNDAPFLFAGWYAVWTVLVMLLYRRAYLDWATSQLPPADWLPRISLALAFGWFAVWGLQMLPAINWPDDGALPGLLGATTWYFLTKSVEIWFQQVLITTMIIALHQHGLKLRTISILVSVLFGVFHLSLVFSGHDNFYVARYTIAASAYGLLIPWLMLKVRNGFAWSYALHWGFYAADATIAHLVGDCAFSKPKCWRPMLGRTRPRIESAHV